MKSMTREEYECLSGEYKGMKDGQPYALYLDDDGATVYGPVELVERSLVGQTYHDPKGREITVVSESTPAVDMLLEKSRPDLFPQVKVRREDGRTWAVERSRIVAVLEEQAP